jgi:ABC-type uncharacterized transport system substrate-binding protein
MRRREFIAGLGGVVAWPLVAHSQRPAVPVIGFISSQAPAAATDFVAAFRGGLAEIGFVEGRNVEIVYRWAEDQPARLQALAADLVGRRAAVIVAVGGRLVGLAVRGVTESTPLVFTSGVDPIKLGLVESFNRPGGNATGVNVLITAIETKRLGLLRELSPASATLALILNPHAVDAPKHGGLLSYGPDLTDAYHQSGNYVGRILKGARAADLPVIQSTKLALVINLKTAKALGLTIPETLLATADEVIQ